MQTFVLGIQGENVDGGRVNTADGRERGDSAKRVPEKLLCRCLGAPHFEKDREVESCWVSGGSAVTSRLFARPARLQDFWVEARCSAGL